MMKPQLLLAMIPAALSNSPLENIVTITTTTTTAATTMDPTHRRLLFATQRDTNAVAVVEEGVRGLANELPSDLSICDEYFFGRQSNLETDQLPFCVNGG